MDKENSILNRLLLLQPVQNISQNTKITNNKKLSIQNHASNAKYNPKFQKPDI